ncbi:NAD(P)/FAD-dependent oxidoreductase [Carboxylicivirga sp. A043]|uniref:phytoene desaturase family protein n=1 Tax=Carboxylicivirga litoralis TaxID=2816963 RepID=UPI0021CB6BD5|nr:NAD(P)/FAD-dependent oxidoreductase [Carboxylicivirga sp. A043]MCU4154361.1 NAD(P)/FAD-dependent oxidoreductase [Carboxylicivirga sp. A043]
MSVQNTYDIVIIGSGLGGLACGSILSQRGYKVCILEQHFQIGGCLQDFKRNGQLFDTGMHYIGSYEDGQILNTLFRYFNIYDKIEVSKLDENGFDVLQAGGNEFAIPQGVDAFRDKLIKQFPEEEKAIITYFDKILEIYNSVDIVNLRNILNFDFEAKKGEGENVYDFVASLTDNLDLRNILCYSNSLYAGKKESASLFIHAIINVFYLQSAWTLVKGGGQIAGAFKDVIEANGGEVIINARVTRLVCQNDKIEEIQIEGCEPIKGKQVISNIEPLTTMQMVEGANIRKVYLKRLQQQEQTISCYSLYCVLNERSVKYANANFYYYKNNEVWGLDDYDESIWPQGYMLYMKESSIHKGFAESITLLSPMDYNEMEPWFDTGIEKRGNDYKQMKLEKGERLLDLLEDKYPDIRLNIKATYASTPLTFRDYTGVRGGAMYGVKTDSRNPVASQVLPRTRVKNLFLTGQNINMHGILGVSVSAIITCGEILGINSIIDELRTFKQEAE